MFSRFLLVQNGGTTEADAKGECVAGTQTSLSYVRRVSSCVSFF